MLILCCSEMSNLFYFQPLLVFNHCLFWVQVSSTLKREDRENNIKIYNYTLSLISLLTGNWPPKPWCAQWRGDSPLHPSLSSLWGFLAVVKVMINRHCLNIVQVTFWRRLFGQDHPYLNEQKRKEKWKSWPQQRRRKVKCTCAWSPSLTEDKSLSII